MEDIRSNFTNLRGKLFDIQRLYPGWKERFDHAEGGLTCVMAALYPGMLEYRVDRLKA